MEYAALLKFTVAMLHVVRTLRFTRPLRIYCLFLLLQNILRLCVKIMLIVSTIINGFLKQHRATIQIPEQHGATVQIPERNYKTCILVEITMWQFVSTNSTTLRCHLGITFVILCINIKSEMKVQIIMLEKEARVCFLISITDNQIISIAIVGNHFFLSNQLKELRIPKIISKGVQLLACAFFNASEKIILSIGTTAK